MLTIFQKANILCKAGFHIPACPGEGAAGGPAASEDSAMQSWFRAIETLFVSYTAARAAKSLRDAEAARHLDMLQRMSSSRSYA